MASPALTLPTASPTPTDEELFCSLEVSGKKYIEPIFTPWNEPGTYYSKAERDSKAASNIFDRLTARKEINKWNLSHQHYIEAGETRLFDWMVPAYASSPIPGDSLFLECNPEGRYKTILVGYGVVQDDLSVKSDNLPSVSTPAPKPDTKETISVPTTVWKTTTVKAPAPAPITKTATVTAAAKQPTPIATTVRETATTTVTATPKQPAAVTTTVTETKEVPTSVTKQSIL